MTRLNQIIALEKGSKAGAHQALTKAYHAIQRTPQLSGITRTYLKKDDDGDDFPPESTRVQVRTDEIIAGVTDSLTRMFDLVATKEWANTQAFADVKIGDRVLLDRVPVTYLLFLEKQLVDLKTFVGKLPTLDPAERWTPDEDNGGWRTEPVETVKTKKVKRNHVLAPATEKHPAQVQPYDEDTVVGKWRTTKFSGAMQSSRVAEVLHRIDTLQAAVKMAREEANLVKVTDQNVGARVFAYLFVQTDAQTPPPE